MQHFYVEAAGTLPAGEHQVRMEFAYAGGGLGKGGKVTLYVDGKKVGEGDVPMTLAMIFSADDGCDVGEDSGAPVSPDYGPRGNAFNGRIKGVQIAIADAAENRITSSHRRKPSASPWRGSNNRWRGGTRCQARGHAKNPEYRHDGGPARTALLASRLDPDQ